MSYNLKKTYQKYISKGLSPIFLAFYYFLISGLPFILIFCSGIPSRSFPNEIATHFGLIAYLWIILSFLLSGRFRSISGKIGIDKTIRFHQFMAIVLGIFLFLHPYLYTLPISNPLPWDASRQFSLLLTFPAYVSGMFAWIILFSLVITALFRDDLPFSYETWRLLHGLGAVIIVIGSTIHVFDIGRYTEAIPLLKYLWLSLIIFASLTLWRTYLILPFYQKRHPFKVVSVLPAALKTWHLTITSDSKQKFNFSAGQFSWIKLKESPHGLKENPFSISSSPSDLPNIRFTIKEIGDTTNNIGSLKANDIVYIDGPHGHFIINDRNFDGIFMIAGGVGVAPMISIIKEMMHNKDKRPIELIYGNRLQTQIAFQDELKEASKLINLDTHYVLSKPPKDWMGNIGHVDKELIEQIMLKTVPNKKWLFLLCGPPAMIISAIETLKYNGIQNHQIQYEKFSYFS
jgi:predicted ferric reductase